MQMSTILNIIIMIINISIITLFWLPEKLTKKHFKPILLTLCGINVLFALIFIFININIPVVLTLVLQIALLAICLKYLKKKGY